MTTKEKAFDWTQVDTPNGESSFVRFENVGDSITGEVQDIRLGLDFNKNECPELLLLCADGSTKTLTAAQVMLKSALRAADVQPGDVVTITYSGKGAAKPGKAPAKLFEVKFEE